MIMILFSVCIGIFLVFKKDEIVKMLSDELDKRKRIEIKKKDKHGLKSTLNNIGIKSKKGKTKFTMKISSKTPVKDKFIKVKNKIVKPKKKRKGPDYLEFE